MSHNSLILRTVYGPTVWKDPKMPKVMCVLNEHLATSKRYTNINYFFEELITEGKTFIAFCEHTHWVHARYPLKDPTELPGAGACFGGCGWDLPSACLVCRKTLSLGEAGSSASHPDPSLQPKSTRGYFQIRPFQSLRQSVHKSAWLISMHEIIVISHSHSDFKRCYSKMWAEKTCTENRKRWGGNQTWIQIHLKLSKEWIRIAKKFRVN